MQIKALSFCYSHYYFAFLQTSFKYKTNHNDDVMNSICELFFSTIYCYLRNKNSVSRKWKHSTHQMDTEVYYDVWRLKFLSLKRYQTELDVMNLTINMYDPQIVPILQ